MTTATEHNDRARNRRQQAAEEQSNVVNLDRAPASISLAELYQLANEQADLISELGLEVKALNERRNAILDGIEAKGFDRRAFRDMCKLKALEEDRRLKYEATRRQLAKAFGFGDGLQLDMLAGIEVTVFTPREDAPMTPVRLDAIAEHIAKHGSTAAPSAIHS